MIRLDYDGSTRNWSIESTGPIQSPHERAAAAERERNKMGENKHRASGVCLKGGGGDFVDKYKYSQGDGGMFVVGCKEAV